MLFQDRGYNNFGTYFLSGSEQPPMFGICFDMATFRYESYLNLIRNRYGENNV